MVLVCGRVVACEHVGDVLVDHHVLLLKKCNTSSITSIKNTSSSLLVPVMKKEQETKVSGEEDSNLTFLSSCLVFD